VPGLWERDDQIPTVDGIDPIPQRVELTDKKKRESAPASRARKASQAWAGTARAVGRGHQYMSLRQDGFSPEDWERVK
jgi:hypothetical protein